MFQSYYFGKHDKAVVPEEDDDFSLTNLWPYSEPPCGESTASGTLATLEQEPNHNHQRLRRDQGEEYGMRTIQLLIISLIV